MSTKKDQERRLRLRRQRLQQLGTMTAEELRNIAGGVPQDGGAKNVSRGCEDS